MRWVALMAGAAATPLAAQDHSAHHGHHSQEEAPKAAVQELDHCAMGHVPPEHCPPATDHDSAQAPPVMDGHSASDHSAMDDGQMDHSGMDHAAMNHSSNSLPRSGPPPRAFEGPQHAADVLWGAQAMARARAINHATHGDMKVATLLVERFEARLTQGEDGFVWDASGWYGSATEKFVLKTEGEGALASGEVADAEFQALWGHAIGPFVDLQAGIRVDVEPASTAYLALGAAGLAPYMIHFDAAAFLSKDGDLLARIEAEHDMKLTQRLILQPRVEAELSAQDIPERGVGSGLSKLEAGLRLRYEIVREFAPYVGIEQEWKTGGTADYARADSEDASATSVLVGLRFWF